MEGKIALITGSTRGIGAAIAEALAARGCNVMLNGFGEPDDIAAQCEHIRASYGVSASHHPADLAHEADVDALTRDTVRQLGPIDILVNNAVIRYFHTISDFERDEWRHAMAVNVTAPFLLTQNVLPSMRARGFGRIVNFSSVLGMAGRSGRADYITAKHAMLGLTRATAAETTDEPNVTCNAICPGTVYTPNTERKIEELADEEGVSFDEAKRLFRSRRGSKALPYIEPEKVARFVVFLCEEASAEITGAALPIDQGRSATWLEAG